LKQDGRDRLEFDVHPEFRHLLDEILDEPKARVTFGFEDDAELLDAFARHGFKKPDDPMHFNSRPLDDPPPLPELPDGFRYRTVTEADLAERVAIHRDVWKPSRVTETSYATVMTAWPYRSSLDCVVEAPDGRFAAYVLAWPDDENGVGLFEPVGTRAEFRRRGLGAAVCTFALQRLYDEGLRHAVVMCESEPACGLYESVGFRRQGTLVAYAR